MLLPAVKPHLIEAGCDEAGRGCLAGPVVASAVIFPKLFNSDKINDSKKMSALNRSLMKQFIDNESITFGIGVVSEKKIDEINILQASLLAMHRALDKLSIEPKHISIDGNKFNPYKDIDFTTVIKGDGKYINIAAASIMAKTYRDEFMQKLHLEYPMYGWNTNMGYPTAKHREAIRKYGITPYHRKTFRLVKK